MKVLVTVKAEVDIGTYTPSQVKTHFYTEVKEAVEDHLLSDDYDVEPVHNKENNQ